MKQLSHGAKSLNCTVQPADMDGKGGWTPPPYSHGKKKKKRSLGACGRGFSLGHPLLAPENEHNGGNLHPSLLGLRIMRTNQCLSCSEEFRLVRLLLICGFMGRALKKYIG